MRAIAIGCLLLAWCPAVSALDPGLDITQYAHTAWRIREGFAKSYVSAAAQTRDGYMWLGSEFGLSRFDGVRTTPWQPPAGSTLPDARIRALLGARDGALWIGTLRGLASWRDGKLTHVSQFAGFGINALAEDKEGTVWVTAMDPPRVVVLCAIRGGSVSCEADKEVLGNWVTSLHVDSQDRVWVASEAGVWNWRPGPRRLHQVDGSLGTLQSLTEGDQGSMLVATRSGVAQISASGDVSMLPLVMPVHTQPARLFRDRHGGVWIGTTDRGLMRTRSGRVDTFTRADGLSGEAVQQIFEGHEGNIWVATLDGFDRFSDVAVSTFSVVQGLPNALIASVLGARDGSIWISTRIGLYRWRDGEGTAYLARRSAKPASREIIVPGLPERAASLFEDSRGRIWIGSDLEVGYLERGRFIALDGVARQWVDAFVEDQHGTLWMALRNAGLHGVTKAGRTVRVPWSQLGHEDAAMRLAVDPLRGGLWLGFADGGIAHFLDGRVVRSVSPADGLGKGRVESLRVDADGTLWVGTEGGLSRIRDERIVTLSDASGLPCNGIDWMIGEGASDVWLHTSCGLVRIKRADLDAALAARERGEAQPTLPLTLFGASDGVANTQSTSTFSPHVARSADGRLWFATQGGVGVLNPQRIPHNPIPPPVHIEQVIADRKPHDPALASGSLALPALTRDLQIDYTALSFTAPEKMRFRYRLQDYDETWRDVGTRRQAFYTDLPPGDYRFQVIASNNDGVWNETGASVNLSIAPTFYQTRWFTALCIASGGALLWLLLWFRGRQIEMRMRLRLEERVLERERLARDLHDTFLQSMQGLVLRFHAVLAKLPQEGPARYMMEQALNRADDVITEGRAHVYDLRQSANVTNDLPQALTAVGEERAETTDTKFRVIIEGAPRNLHPVVREEAYRIGAEALANAFRHAEAGSIDVHIEYGRKALTLRVVDDGRGYDVGKLHDMVTQGHFGLAGLRERAHRIRAQLEVSSRMGAGSAVELRVPASIAYASPSADRSHAV